MCNSEAGSVLRIGLMAATALGSALAWVAPALAQTAGPDTSTAEILVTARKQSERLQDVPSDVTALTAEAITKLGVKNLFDLMSVTPSLSYANVGQRSTNKLTLRGLGISTVGTSKASVFLDGVYVAGDYTGIDITGLERVEVLKGPQSAVFGRASFAGAINYVTPDGGNTVTGGASADYATFGQTRLSANVSGPLIDDKLFGFLSASYYNFDAPDAWKDALNGSRHGSQDTKALISKLTWKPTQDITIKGLYSFNKDVDGPSSALFINPASRNGQFAKINPITGVPTGAYAYYPVGTVPSFQPKSGDYQFFEGYLPKPGDRIEQSRGYVNVDWRLLGGHDLTFTAALDHQQAESQSNAYLSPRPPAGISFNSIAPSTTDDVSYEARFTSPQNQPIRYALGLYYLDLKVHAKPGISYYVEPTAALDLVSPGAYSLSENTDRSAFAAVYWDIIKPLTLSVESRYQQEEVIRTGATAGTVPIALYNAGVLPALTPIHAPDGSTYDKTFPAFLPRVNLQYKFNRDLNVYATYSIGDNPGGFNTSAYATPSQTSFKEEKIKNYEFGVKGSFWHSLTFDAAIYQMDWSNVQTSGSYYNGNIIYVITENHGAARVRGAEAEASWKTPIEGLDFRGTISYNDAKYLNYCSSNYAALTYVVPATATPAQKIQYSCRSIAGNSLESISPVQSSLTGNYERPVFGNYEGYLRGDWRYWGKQYDSELNLAQVPEANVVDLRVGIEDARSTLEFYVTNLTDEDAPTRVTRVSDIQAGPTNTTNQSIAFTPRIPRQFGVRLAYRF